MRTTIFTIETDRLIAGFAKVNAFFHVNVAEFWNQRQRGIGVLNEIEYLGVGIVWTFWNWEGEFEKFWTDILRGAGVKKTDVRCGFFCWLF